MSLNSLCYLSHIFRSISAFKLMQEIRRQSSLNSFYLFFNLLFSLNYTSASASTIRTVSLCFYYDFVLWTDLRPFQLFLFILCSDVLLLHCSPRLGGVCRKETCSTPHILFLPTPNQRLSSVVVNEFVFLLLFCKWIKPLISLFEKFNVCQFRGFSSDFV